MVRCERWTRHSSHESNGSVRWSFYRFLHTFASRLTNAHNNFTENFTISAKMLASKIRRQSLAIVSFSFDLFRWHRHCYLCIIIQWAIFMPRRKDRIDKMPIRCLPTQWMPRLLLFILLIWLHAVKKPFIDCFESLLRNAPNYCSVEPLIWIFSNCVSHIRHRDTAWAENWEAQARQRIAVLYRYNKYINTDAIDPHTHTINESRRDHGRSFSVGPEQTNNQHYFK